MTTYNISPLLRDRETRRNRCLFFWPTLIAVLLAAVSCWLVYMDVNWRPRDSESTTLHVEMVHCDVIIAGAGLAGSHAAYHLAIEHRERLCVIEKEGWVGGRLFDVPEGDEPGAGGPVFGLGGLRINKHNHNMMALARKLSIAIESSSSEREVYKVRGRYYDRNQTEFDRLCKEAFNLNCTLDMAKNMFAQVKGFYENVVLKQAGKYEAYFDARSFISSIHTDEGFKFMQSITRYISLFSTNSVRGLMDFMWNPVIGMSRAGPSTLYPTEGMAQFPKRLMDKALKYGVRLFLNEPALNISMNFENVGKLFAVTTATRSFFAPKLLIAIDPYHLSSVGGNLVDYLRKNRHFRAIRPVKVAVAAAWWPERFWEISGQPLVSRVSSHDNCFAQMEIPTHPSAGALKNVTRAVYDDGVCVDQWERLFDGPVGDFQQVLVRSLANFYANRTVPLPRSLKGKVWQNGWFFQQPDSPFENEDIAKWAARPVPGRSVALIGEGYNLRFSAWAEGAVVSSINALVQHFDVTFDDCSCAPVQPSEEIECRPRAC